MAAALLHGEPIPREIADGYRRQMISRRRFWIEEGDLYENENVIQYLIQERKLNEEEFKLLMKQPQLGYLEKLQQACDGYMRKRL